MIEHGWQSLFRENSRSRVRLRAALFTTYDRPDERFLVERLLPDLLGIEPDFEGERRERDMFYGKLATRLEELRGYLAVVSSMPQARGEALRAYPWLWRHVHQLHVGRHANAIQHAKLWLLHWQDDEAERVEVVVSSANLTDAAARDQIQACWRAVVEAGESATQLPSWGLLPEFLDKLVESAGGGRELVAHFRALFARCACPPGVTFLASVPGTHSSAVLRRTAWGSKGLSQVAPAGGPTRITVTAPYVGTWDDGQLRDWCGAMEASTAALQLVWIDRHHPWATQAGGAHWRLPEATLQGLRKAKATLLQLDPDTRVHREHRGRNDPRWSHAKLYHLRRARSERLIITSANFSRAAWGESRGSSLHIRNFEFGVCLEQSAWPLEELDPFDDLREACTVEAEPMQSECAIAWADACWDGTVVEVRCRTKDGLPPTLQVSSPTRTAPPVSAWTRDEETMVARVPWHGIDPPVSAVICVADERRELGIRDMRPIDELQRSPLPEVAAEDSTALRDRLLLEEFGHYTPDGDDPVTAPGSSSDAPSDDADEPLAANYGVEVFEQARTRFDVVDSWEQRVQRSLSSDDRTNEGRYLLTQGHALVRVLRSRAERAATPALALPEQLCAEELAWRLEMHRSALEASDG